MTDTVPSLSQRYAAHNANRGRGFIFGGHRRIDALKAFLPASPELVLDLGCRDGSLAEALGLDSGRVLGADIDGEALAAARGRVVPCMADLWRSFPFRSDVFDLALAGEIVEHVPFPQSLIAETARVLKPGGVIVGSVPNAFRLKNRLVFLAGGWFEKDPTHLRQFSIAMLRNLLAEYFESVSIRPAVGRFATFWPRMTANDLVWRASNPLK